MKSAIPSWLPASARQKILALLKTPGLTDANRALLVRLATYPAMKTDVWNRLPSKPPGKEGVIIESAFHAITLYSILPVPRPSSTAKKGAWKKWADNLTAHPPALTPASAHARACLLVEAMNLLETDIAHCWPSYWDGPKNVSREQVVSIVKRLPNFFARMDGEHQRFIENIPGVTRRGKRILPQRFFTLLLSKRLQEIYGKPLDTVVAALAEVTFDISDGLDAETVRGRRRIGTHRKK